MRHTMIALASAMVMAGATASYAQATLPKPTDARDVAASSFGGRILGSVDFGARFTSIDGDEARYQRYRDLRDGPFAQNALFSRRTEEWTLDAFATNVGYRDQKYTVEYRNVGKLNVSFLWDQIPLLISTDTRSLFTEVQPGIFRLEDVIQSNNEAGRTTIRDYTDQAAEFELRTRRDIGALNVIFNATRELDLRVNVTTIDRQGAIPYGGPFGFNNLVELPAPINQRTTDARTTLEWAGEEGTFSVGWDGSWFDNNVESMIWDNPLKINDSPSYASAYSDGRGPAQARMALWPTNNQQYVHATGSVPTPGRGRATAYVAFGEARQDASLLPHTINTQIPVIPLERATAEAELRNTLLNLQYSARPTNVFGVVARYRYSNVDNRTPHFETFGRVRFDGALDDAATAPEPEPFSVKRRNFDVDGTFNILPFTAIKVGYGNAIGDRTFRVFEETTEHTFRVSADATGNQYFSVRGLFEASSREGDLLDLEPQLAAGELPDMRHYDVADRDRKRFTVLATATPNGVIGINGSVGVGRDEYPDSGFGLQSHDTNQYSVGVDVIPSDRIGFSLVWALEGYTSLTRSRTAAPNTITNGVLQTEDPRRNWFMDYDGKVKNVDATIDVAELAPRTDLRVSVNWSDADDVYTYALTSDTVLPAPSQLAPVVNELLRGTVDLTHRLSNRVRIGASYWYENYDTEDFAFGPTTISDIALPPVQPGFPIVPTNSLLLGYLYRPYTAHTGLVRLTYLW